MKLKPLVQMMAMLSAVLLPVTTALYASDLSIYQPNSGGKKSIFLMLDTSGSMGISSLVLPNKNDYGSPGDLKIAENGTYQPLCTAIGVNEAGNSSPILEWQYNLSGFDAAGKPIKADIGTNSPTSTKPSAVKKEVVINGSKITYYLRGCTDGTKWEYDRLSRMKDAIIQLLASNKLKNEIIMGMGHFSSKTDLIVGKKGTSTVPYTDSHSGRVIVPSAPLSAQQRYDLAAKLAEFRSLDTRTDEDGIYRTTAVTTIPKRAKADDLKISATSMPDYLKAAGGTPTAHAYAEAGAYMLGTNTGIDATTSRVEVKYVYDGSAVLRRKNTSGLEEQTYWVCVSLKSSKTDALGHTQNVKQCSSPWPKLTANKTGYLHETLVNSDPGGVKNENGVAINWPNTTINLGNIDSVWGAIKSLPNGYTIGGWMKVPYNPLDIEAITGKIWAQVDSNVDGLFSYRTNPFVLDETPDSSDTPANNIGGFAYSVSESKQGTNYSPAGSSSSCDGNGIYFLTDGAPNSTKQGMAEKIMGASLGESASFSCPSGTLVSPSLAKSSMFSGETGRWECIAEYAKRIRDSSLNTQKMSIKTAVVGFGSSFEDLRKKADGTYDCDSTTNLDAKNACKWGSDEYGGGGFYQATNSDDIANSIIDFVEKVQVPFAATSLGSISIPRDPLDQTQIMTEGFFPMISPVDDSAAATNQKFMVWAGNLKKYKIVDGTLKDANDNPIYKTENNEQKINSTARDLWSIAENTDHSFVASGGALNKIPVPSLLNIKGEPSKANSQRNVFIMDDTSLKAVTKENLATDVTSESALPNSVTVAQRYALMNYLGYSASMPTGATALTTTTLNGLTASLAQSPYRFMGGVVHSTPVLATQEAKISSGNNTVESRKEYVIYGSMEGGLHIVDASTGQEQSVFIPKEILANQLNTLASKEPKGAGLVYGVDAPWLVDSQYKVKNTVSQVIEDGVKKDVTTTAYTANLLRAYGGLRMGGVGFYGLDISKVAAPTLLFHIDAKKNGFSRLAQTWNKPTITDIRYKGKRTRVLIFGGGYDASVYENETTTNPTGPTLGNALYVVDAENGDLIWSASSSITDSTDRTNHEDIKFSVVAQPAVRDYDSDGLVDMIYFADLGGQIFRVDLNNLAHMNNIAKNIAVRVQKIASLAETNFTPRFYDRVTTAVFGSGAERHVFVSVGSGNRSYPLQSSAAKNKIYGILDYDAAKNGIEKTTYTGTFQAVATMGTKSNMLNRGSVGKNSSGENNLTVNGLSLGKNEKGETILIDSNYESLKNEGKNRGWYFELNSKGDGTPIGSNYAKSFEESQLILGDLYVNVYDPKASLGKLKDSCTGGVKGLSTVHRICAPYGDCVSHVKTDYQGIIGPTLGGLTNPARTTQLIGPITPDGEKCIGRCDVNTVDAVDQNLKKYSQSRVIRPTRWFEW